MEFSREGEIRERYKGVGEGVQDDDDDDDSAAAFKECVGKGLGERRGGGRWRRQV